MPGIHKPATAPPSQPTQIAHFAPQQAAPQAKEQVQIQARSAPPAPSSGHSFANISVFPPQRTAGQDAVQENRTGLPDDLKAGIEAHSGLALDAVRTHYNSAAPAAVQALAYTQGTEIHIGPGQERYLPHEAWHVVQQLQGRVPPTGQAQGVLLNDDERLEREADAMGVLLRGSSPPAPSHAAPKSSAPARQPKSQPIQRQVLSKIDIVPPDGDPPVYVIGDVIIGGRTPSPFSGTMGAHSTAWVAHIDVVRRHLVNMELVTGIDWLIGLAEEELAGPLAQVPDDDQATPADDLSGMLETEHKKKLVDAKARLVAQIAAAHAAIDPLRSAGDAEAQANAAKQQVQALRALIDGYLTLVNYLPAATVRGGDPSGHGEGSTRGELNLFEYTRAKVMAAGMDALSKEFRDLLDTLTDNPYYSALKTQAKAKFAGDNSLLRQMLIERLWALFSAETPDVFTGSMKAKRLHVWKALLHHFIGTIRKAYPYSFDFTQMDQPANQLAGLEFALKKAGVRLDPEFSQALIQSLTNDAPQAEPSQIRDDYSEVAASDFNQAGTGFQANLLMQGNIIGNVDLVGAVEMIGRTQSPFSGTMGAHSTAWVAHLDALRQLLINKTLDNAIAALINRSRAALADRSLVLADLIDEKHQIYLIGAYNVLWAAIAKDVSTLLDPEKMSYLEKLILDYLRYLNFLPLSTVAIGGVPGGRKEGAHRAFLLNYEDYGASIIPRGVDRRQLLCEHLLGLYDPGAVASFPPALGRREATDFREYVAYEENHPLRIFVENKTKDASQKEEIAYSRFQETILEAYPRATLDSGLLQESMPRHRDERRDAILKDEGERLADLLQRNNCLINAIVRAYRQNNNARITQAQLMEIRLRIGEFGTMLFASERVINIIREVLNIQAGIVVIYADGRPSEDFGDTTHNPIMIVHNGALHFEPMRPEETLTIVRVESGGYKRRHDDKSRSSGIPDKESKDQ